MITILLWVLLLYFAGLSWYLLYLIQHDLKKRPHTWYGLCGTNCLFHLMIVGLFWGITGFISIHLHEYVYYLSLYHSAVQCLFGLYEIIATHIRFRLHVRRVLDEW